MDIFKRSKKAKASDGKCKKHPKHKQSPGVCSLCLNEKLNQISVPSLRINFTTIGSSCPSSLSSYCSSSYCSCCSSPGEYHLEGKGLLSLLFERTKVLTKSRSMEFVPRKKHGDPGDDDTCKENKKAGFWSKLLHSRKDGVFGEI